MRLFESERSGKLYQKVLELAGIFYNAGGRALLVGGAVRDALLGRQVKDFDLEIHGLSSEQLLACLNGVCEVDAVGMSFGVIKVKHLELDISLPRRENKVGQGHRGFLVEVDPHLSYADAAARRDFTVNAIMYDPLTEELLDPHGGVRDLENKVLRHVSSHFAEDPLRVLRGMQFASRMAFDFAPETIELCSRISQNELAVERIGTEWEKMLLQGKAISKGLAFLKSCRWSRFYPELDSLSDPAWEKLGAFLDSCALLRNGERQKDMLFMTGALVTSMPAAAGKSFCRRLWNREELIGKALRLAETFLEVSAAPGALWSAAQVRRIALRLDGTELLCRLLEGAGLLQCSKNIEEIAGKESVREHAPVPLITGKHGIGSGIAPGPELGTLVKRCFEAQLDGVFNDLEGGKIYLQSLIRSKN